MVKIVGIGSLNNIFQPRLLLGQCVKIRIRLGVIRIHLLQARQRIHGFLQTLFDIAVHALIRIQLRSLRQIADLYPRLRPRLPKNIRTQPRHNPQQRRFARAVQTQHANLGAGKERQRNIFQDGFLGWHNLANPIHGVNVLGHFFAREDLTTKRGF